jgi:hypothetical protein
MARELVFYRATYGVRVRTSPKRGDYSDWTVRSFSFWQPVSEAVLRSKIVDVVEQMGYTRIADIGYEEEDVGSSESSGIGFYRWDVIDEEAHAEVARIHRDYVVRPDGSEVRWRR